MLRHKITFDSKKDFLNYIEKKMTEYWKAHNDSFSRVCEELDSYDGFLDDNRIYPMDELDDLLCDKKPSEILQIVDTATFDYSDDYFYYDTYEIHSTNEKDYYNYFDYSYVFKELIDDYNQVFTTCYGHAYHKLFEDVYYITRWDEDEIQDYMNDNHYEYLFVDNDDFFLHDDLTD